MQVRQLKDGRWQVIRDDGVCFSLTYEQWQALMAQIERAQTRQEIEFCIYEDCDQGPSNHSGYCDLHRMEFQGFCHFCGASVPHRVGEGRCQECMPYLDETSLATQAKKYYPVTTLEDILIADGVLCIRRDDIDTGHQFGDVRRYGARPAYQSMTAPPHTSKTPCEHSETYENGGRTYCKGCGCRRPGRDEPKLESLHEKGEIVSGFEMITDEPRQCFNCDGRGYLRQINGLHRECHKCNGTGKDPVESELNPPEPK